MLLHLRIHYKALLIILALSISVGARASHPEKLINKAEKLALKNFRDTEIVKEPVQIHSSDYFMEKKDTVFRLLNKEGEMMGYLVISSALGRFEEFDFMMVYNEEPILTDMNILVYRSEYGYQVSTRGWLKQFLHHPIGTTHTYGQDIDAISGASFSGKSLTDNVNRLNNLIGTLSK